MTAAGAFSLEEKTIHYFWCLFPPSLFSPPAARRPSHIPNPLSSILLSVHKQKYHDQGRKEFNGSIFGQSQNEKRFQWRLWQKFYFNEVNNVSDVLKSDSFFSFPLSTYLANLLHAPLPFAGKNKRGLRGRKGRVLPIPTPRLLGRGILWLGRLVVGSQFNGILIMEVTKSYIILKEVRIKLPLYLAKRTLRVSDPPCRRPI